MDGNDSGTYYISFVVRPASAGAQSKILFKHNLNTIQAYNYWGGGSLYSATQEASLDTTYMIAIDRPVRPDFATAVSYTYTALVKFLEDEGYSVDYCNNIDVDSAGQTQDEEIGANLLNKYKMLTWYDHDEYWSKKERDNIESDFMGTTVQGNIASFSPNTCYWRVNWVAGSGHSRLTCLKEKDNYVDLFSNTTFGPSQKFLGVDYVDIASEYPADSAYHWNHWIFRGTTVSANNRVFGYGFDHGAGRQGIVQGEIDNTALFKTSVTKLIVDTIAQRLVWCDSSSHQTLHQMVYCEDDSSNSRVFSQGASAWGNGLDSTADHDSDVVNMKQITRNIFDHFSGKKYIGNVYTDTINFLVWSSNIRLDGYVNILATKKLQIKGSTTTTTVTADSALFVNGELEINGVVTIAGGGSLNINPGGVLRLKSGSTLKVNPATFIMDAGSTIVYESGATLVLNQGVIFDGASLTVASGGTLQVVAGGSLSFGSGSNLVALGTVTATGSSQNRITFTSTGSQAPGCWGLIDLEGSGASGSTLNHVKVEYGTEIKTNDVPSFVINNSTIDNMVNGVNAIGSNGWVMNSTITNLRDHGIIANNSTIACYFNTITKSNHAGAGILYTNDGGDYIFQNNISGFNWGVGSIYGSFPYFGHPSNTELNNLIQNCLEGIRAYQYSGIYMGADDPEYTTCSYSSFQNTNTLYVKVYDYSDVFATYNYWGQYPPDSSKFSIYNGGTMDYSSPLVSDPWFPNKALPIDPGKFSISPRLSTQKGHPFEIAMKLRAQNKFGEALVSLKESIARMNMFLLRY